MFNKSHILIKSSVTILAIAIIFSSGNLKTVLAETGGTVPATPIASPIGTPYMPAYPTSDAGTQMNTNLIVKNTYSIASSLTGLTPGAQQDKVKAGLGMVIIKRLLREITKATVAWINGGFNGNPSFITDTKQWLTDTADITIGDYLMNEPGLNFLCDPFKLQVKLALGLQYRPFKEDIQCSFTSALGNVNDAMNKFVNGDFIGGGGWDAWLQMTTVPQNNQMGAMMLAQGELDARLDASTRQSELEANWGGGYMSYKRCEDMVTGKVEYGSNTTVTRTNINNDGANTTTSGGVPSNTRSLSDGSVQSNRVQCTTETPGSSIASLVPYFSTEDLRQAEVANDLNEIMNALVNQILQKGMATFGSGKLLGGSSNNGGGLQTAGQQYSAEVLDYLNTINNQVYGTDINNSGGPASYNDQSFASKTYALSYLAENRSVETDYLAKQQTLYELLTKAGLEFNSSTSTTCTADVKSDILGQINGTINYSKTAAGNLSRNKTDIGYNSTSALDNITALDTARTAVNNSSSDSAIPGILTQNLSTVSLHPSAAIGSYSLTGAFGRPIVDWVVSKMTVCSISTGSLSDWGI